MKHIRKFNENLESFNDTIIKVSIADDWQGLYLDGELVYEGHSLDLMEGLKTLSTMDVTNLKDIDILYFSHQKDGRYRDFLTEDEFYEVGIRGNCTKTLNEYIEKISKAGYTYELK